MYQSCKPASVCMLAMNLSMSSSVPSFIKGRGGYGDIYDHWIMSQGLHWSLQQCGTYHCSFPAWQFLVTSQDRNASFFGALGWKTWESAMACGWRHNRWGQKTKAQYSHILHLSLFAPKFTIVRNWSKCAPPGLDSLPVLCSIILNMAHHLDVPTIRHCTGSPLHMI